MMPRLLICNESISSGGIGTFTLSVAKTFRHRGWEVGFVATHGPGEYFYEISALASPCRDLSDMPLGWRKITAFLAVIENFYPDVILLNHCSLAHYLLPFISAHSKPVAVLHNDVPLFYETAALFQSRIFRWIAPTQKLNNAFREYLPEGLQERVCTIHHGVDEISFYRHSTLETSRRIVFIGHLGENKGADLLPEIFEQVISRLPDAQLNVVGEGPLKHSVQQKFAQKNISVTFTGAVSPNSVPEILSSADILLLPTRVEGFGLVIAEGMMCGAVPVVSKLPGITDTIVTNNETGLLVNVDDIGGFSSMIIDLLSNPDRLGEMKKAAQHAALEKFSLSRMIDDYERLFAKEYDLPDLPRRGVAGWAFETVGEMTRKYPDGTYRIQQKLGTVKKVLMTFTGQFNSDDKRARRDGKKGL